MPTHTQFINWHVAAVLLSIGLLAGCSGVKTYPNTLTKNLHVQTETDSSSLFSTVRAAVSIYGVDADCQLEYEGTVALDESSVAVGIPSDRASYLVFDFSKSSFLANSRSTISYETLLKPAAGRIYDIKVSYIDDIYNVEILETNPGNGAGRHIERRNLSSCKSA
ncbi:MAG: hypothetical protein GWN84_21875 [Gammaproteobacteria bacterium]|nr:hypothetical protein [Gammaproteobacteria bacterium]NIR88819.1 hypothetical protein [Gammaproteobacteria bacterium]NIU06423.1 hypothetical protein [Gammaproteobacteria bacterium]NIV74034.1 hypothetical protein [Gammaproteobacteria bacterium]NIX87696.1 hypothetical protein [Gammaproteobacteria bacterium]